MMFDWFVRREATGSILRRLAEPQWVMSQGQGWSCPKCGRVWAPNWTGPCVCHEKTAPRPGEPQG